MFGSVCAQLYRYGLDGPVQRNYAAWAHVAWEWVKSAGLVSASGLVRHAACDFPADDAVYWSHDQGYYIRFSSDFFRLSRDPPALELTQSVAIASVYAFSRDSNFPLHAFHELACVNPVDTRCSTGTAALSKGIFARQIAYCMEVSVICPWFKYAYCMEVGVICP
jgi:hypothetical protein